MTDYEKRYRDAQEGDGDTAEKRLNARKLSPELEALAKRYDLTPQIARMVRYPAPSS